WLIRRNANAVEAVCGCLEKHPAVHFQGTLWCRIERFSGGARRQDSYDASSFFGGSGSGVALRCSRSAPESAHRRRLVAQLPSEAGTLCATLERVPAALGAHSTGSGVPVRACFRRQLETCDVRASAGGGQADRLLAPCRQ